MDRRSLGRPGLSAVRSRAHTRSQCDHGCRRRSSGGQTAWEDKKRTPVRSIGAEPFIFYSTAHIVELSGRTARTLVELREGIRTVTGSSIFHHTFSLTVTEALWRKRPVIASAVGGIPVQVVHNLAGLLVHTIEGTAHRIRSLLRDPALARRLEENGREYVKTRFLTISNLRAWLALAISLMHPGERIIRLP